MPYLLTLLTALAIALVAFSGALFSRGVLERFFMPRSRFLIAFSVGVFLSIIFTLALEVHEGLVGASVYTFFSVAGAFILGFFFLEVISRFLPETHHHHGTSDHTHSAIDARRLLLSDSVHNVHDGLALVSAFLISPLVGISTATAIFFHELVQEVSEYFIYREAGFSARKALFWNFLSACTIFIGVGIGFFFVSTSAFTLPLIAFAVGGFLSLLIRDLLPSVLRHSKERPFVYLSLIVAGVLCVSAVGALFPEEHAHEHEEAVSQGITLSHVA